MRSLQKHQECKALSLNGDMTHGQHDPRIKEKNEDLQGRPESRKGNKSGHRGRSTACPVAALRYRLTMLKISILDW